MPDNLQEIVDAALQYLSDHPWMKSVLLLAASIVLAKLTDLLVTRVMLRLAGKTKTDLDDQVIHLLHRPIFMSVVLIGINYSLKPFLPTPAPGEASFHTNLLETIAVLLWLSVTIRLSAILLRWMSQHPTRFKTVQPATLPIFDIGAKVVVIGGSVYFLTVAWGYDPTAWMTSAGIVGITLGLAARDTVANLFGGIFILADRPYKIGDFVVLDSGERGEVTRIGLRSTRIMTRDDIEITVPNANIANGKIINESGGPSVKHRIRIAVGVAYGSEIEQVRELLVGIAHKHTQVSSNPTPRVRFRNFGDSSLDFELLCWIDEPVLRGRVKDSLLTTIYNEFNRLEIEIPFPQRDLHVRTAGSSASSGIQ